MTDNTWFEAFDPSSPAKQKKTTQTIKYRQFSLANAGGEWPSDQNTEQIFDKIDNNWDFQLYTDYKQSKEIRIDRQKKQNHKNICEMRFPWYEENAGKCNAWKVQLKDNKAQLQKAIAERKRKKIEEDARKLAEGEGIDHSNTMNSVMLNRLMDPAGANKQEDIEQARMARRSIQIFGELAQGLKKHFNIDFKNDTPKKRKSRAEKASNYSETMRSVTFHSEITDTTPFSPGSDLNRTTTLNNNQKSSLKVGRLQPQNSQLKIREVSENFSSDTSDNRNSSSEESRNEDLVTDVNKKLQNVVVKGALNRNLTIQVENEDEDEEATIDKKFKKVYEKIKRFEKAGKKEYYNCQIESNKGIMHDCSSLDKRSIAELDIPLKDSCHHLGVPISAKTPIVKRKLQPPFHRRNMTNIHHQTTQDEDYQPKMSSYRSQRPSTAKYSSTNRVSNFGRDGLTCDSTKISLEREAFIMSSASGKTTPNTWAQINTKLPHNLTKQLDNNLKCRQKPIIVIEQDPEIAQEKENELMKKTNLAENVTQRIDEGTGQKKWITQNWNDHAMKSQPRMENWEYITHEERVVAALWIKLGGMLEQFDDFCQVAKTLKEQGNSKEAINMQLNSMSTSNRKTGMGGMSAIMKNTKQTMEIKMKAAAKVKEEMTAALGGTKILTATELSQVLQNSKKRELAQKYWTKFTQLTEFLQNYKDKLLLTRKVHDEIDKHLVTAAQLESKRENFRDQFDLDFFQIIQVCEENENYDHTKQDLTDTHTFVKEANKFLEQEELKSKQTLRFGPVKPKKQTKPVTIKYVAGQITIQKPKTPEKIFTKKEAKSIKTYIREDYVTGKKAIAADKEAKAQDIENFHKKQLAILSKRKLDIQKQKAANTIPMNMLANMKPDEENYYYSVPRPYKHMIGQALEIDADIARMGKCKATAFKMRQDYIDKCAADQELVVSVNEIKTKVMKRINNRQSHNKFATTMNRDRRNSFRNEEIQTMPTIKCDESNQSANSFGRTETFTSKKGLNPTNTIDLDRNFFRDQARKEDPEMPYNAGILKISERKNNFLEDDVSGQEEQKQPLNMKKKGRVTMKMDEMQAEILQEQIKADEAEAREIASKTVQIRGKPVLSLKERVMRNIANKQHK